MKNDKVIHRELSCKVMQAVFEVHNTFGPGFVESVDEETLAYELELHGIPFERREWSQCIAGSESLAPIALTAVLQELDNSNRPDDTTGMALMGLATLVFLFWL